MIMLYIYAIQKKKKTLVFQCVIYRNLSTYIKIANSKQNIFTQVSNFHLKHLSSKQS